jgi:hypothetical protein
MSISQSILAALSTLLGGDTLTYFTQVELSGGQISDPCYFCLGHTSLYLLNLESTSPIQHQASYDSLDKCQTHQNVIQLHFKDRTRLTMTVMAATVDEVTSQISCYWQIDYMMKHSSLGTFPLLHNH